ncbi:peptidoglycan editing factor PgeF [Sporolactobacillus sp. THM7-4]|nr:peptidoglycan editing factor PgeF [Sporolactobacillus sp. THM7-4]
MAEPFLSDQIDGVLMMKPVFADGKIISSGISLRTGGSSSAPFSSLNLGLHVNDDPDRVIENRRILAKQIGFPLNRWVCAEQVHGTKIARVTQQDAGSGAESLGDVISGVDGLYTTEPDLLLALCFADCVPVYFYSREPVAVGMLHAGWRGTVHRGAAKMVEVWGKTLGIRPESIHAIVGPAINGRDYEVDERVITEVRKLEKSIWREAVIPAGNGHYLLNLKTLNRQILLRSGVPEKQVTVTGYCTNTHPELFYSYRLEKGRTGRMIGFIGMKDEGKDKS